MLEGATDQMVWQTSKNASVENEDDDEYEDEYIRKPQTANHKPPTANWLPAK